MDKISRILPGAESLPFLYLKPGELYVAWEPTVVCTLLGSCIAVLIYLPNSGVTAVCHSLLPFRRNLVDDNCFRYVDSSIHYMVDALKGHDLPLSYLQVKLFGGADVIKKRANGAEGYSVGYQNVAAARKTLAKYNLPIDVESVGGKKGYKLYIRTDTGLVRMRSLSNKNRGS